MTTPSKWRTRKREMQRAVEIDPNYQPTEAEIIAALSPEERDRLEQLLDSQLRLSKFVRKAWPYVEPSTPYVHGRHIDVICEHLEALSTGDITNLLINIPPRFMKSLLTAVFWPAWEWTRDPGARFTFASYRERLSIRDSLRTRRIVESPWYRQRFPGVMLLPDQNEKMRFDNTAGGFRIASSVGGGNTGEGSDYLCADDPHNLQHIWSEARRDEVIEWWDNVMSSRTGRWATNRKVVVMQRGHEGDLSGHILAEKGDYVHLFLPHEYDPMLKPGRATQPARSVPSPLGRVDWRTTPGELLWPERFDRPIVAQMKRDLSAYAYGSQHQQVPTPGEGGILKREYFRFWEPPNEDFGLITWRRGDGTKLVIVPRKLPFTVDSYVQAWDFTFKGKSAQRERDYVAGHVYAKAGIDTFLMDRIYEQLDFTGTLKAFRDLTSLWPETGHKYYEDAANGPAIESTLHAEIAGIVAVPNDGDLISRGHAITHIHESGHLYFPHPVMCPWVMELIELLVAFPNAAHDDDFSALTTAMRKLYPLPTLSDARLAERGRRRYPTFQS